MMDLIVMSLGVYLAIILLLIVIMYKKPEAFGFLLSALVAAGIISLFFMYVRPELESMNDPQITTAFYIGGVVFFLAIFLLVFFFIRQTKNLKKTNRQLREEAGGGKKK